MHNIKHCSIYNHQTKLIYTFYLCNLFFYSATEDAESTEYFPTVSSVRSVAIIFIRCLTGFLR
jgi:hypothetical protein